jgi:hypothetical protein
MPASDILLLQQGVRVTAPALIVKNKVFAHADGTPFTAIQCSEFHALARFAAGDRSLDAVFAQRAAFGFNLLRTFTLYELEAAAIGRLNPCPYDKVRPFLDYASGYGFNVELVGYTSLKDPAHWDLLRAAADGAPNAFLELVNENDIAVNHIDAAAYSRPSVKASHGSNGSGNWPVEPPWAYMTFHTNDQPQWQRKVGHNAMEIADHYVVPVLSNENTRCPDRDSSPTHFHDAAAGGALLCAGSCFHSVHGKTSELWAPGAEQECARAHVAGAMSVDLSFQGGHYVHRTDLETPSILRAYARQVGADQEVVLIHV